MKLLDLKGRGIKGPNNSYFIKTQTADKVFTEKGWAVTITGKSNALQSLYGEGYTSMVLFRI